MLQPAVNLKKPIIPNLDIWEARDMIVVSLPLFQEFVSVIY